MFDISDSIERLYILKRSGNGQFTLLHSKKVA